MSQPNIKAEQEAFVEAFIEEHENELKDLHSKQYLGLDDEMSDDFDNWLGELTYGDLIAYGLVKNND